MCKGSLAERKTNEKVLETVGTGRVVPSSVRRRQLRFVGHAVRAEALEYLALTGKGRGSRGRPKVKYMDGSLEQLGRNLCSADDSKSER